MIFCTTRCLPCLKGNHNTSIDLPFWFRLYCNKTYARLVLFRHKTSAQAYWIDVPSFPSYLPQNKHWKKKKN